ncbi:MAG: hormogonium polysaccharide biosynthesis glycosyltransferase HpsE, partial [Planktothrix sp.]
MDFSIVIPTYNSETRIVAVLEKLRSQQGTDTIKWEIIVVDNNSSDRTAPVIKDVQNSWDKPFPLRYVFESQQGAASARKRGIKESNSIWVGFLDDDNLPALDWLKNANQFAKEHPQAGAFGSQIHGVYEVEPPPDFDRIKAFLAITERGDKPLLYSPKSKLLPPSAGLVVLRDAWIACVPNHCILTGRILGSMLTSEDLEVLSYIQQSDWEIWYNPKMELDHQIPKNR